MGKKVLVLMGGDSSESAISIATGKTCAKALQELGYNVTSLDITNAGDSLVSLIQNSNTDVVFNALHGPFGEDGKIQAILEYLKIPYTHSGVLASALAMDKDKAKIIASCEGVNVANSIVMNRYDIGNKHPMAVPYVIKPLIEGSCVGVIIIKKEEDAIPSVLSSKEWRFGDRVLVESYVAGREFACGVMGSKALDVCEIFISEQYDFYDIGAKYNPGGSKHICPANILPNIYKDVQIMALKAHQAMGCSGVSRSDFRYNEKTSELVWLEINTQPGMTPTSLLPEIAEVSGISFNELVRWIVEDASCKG